MRILMIGDLVGQPGRQAVRKYLPDLRREHDIDLVVANGENSAAGFGITPKVAKELFDAGVDVISSGNHIWDNRDMMPHMNDETPVLRPLNYPKAAPGRGAVMANGALVVSLQGRTFMPVQIDDPFMAMDNLLTNLTEQPRAIVVDFHAEATSEKGALAWYVDGRVAGVVGTHTHVATADARVLPKGTAFVTDLGMCGAIDSIIGSDPGPVLERFLTGVPVRLNVGNGPSRFNSVLIETDDTTGLATSIRRVDCADTE